MATAPDNSYHMSEQEPESLPDSWLSETLLDNKCFKLLSLGTIGYAAIDD